VQITNDFICGDLLRRWRLWGTLRTCWKDLGIITAGGNLLVMNCLLRCYVIIVALCIIFIGDFRFKFEYEQIARKPTNNEERREWVRRELVGGVTIYSTASGRFTAGGTSD